MKLGDILEVVAGAVAIVCGWAGTHTVWVPLAVFVVFTLYLAQVYADQGAGRSYSLPRTVRAGDTVIVRPTVDVDGDDVASLQAYLQKNLPDNRVVVVPRDTEVAAWHPRGYEPPEDLSRVDRLRGRWKAIRERG